MVRKSTTPRSQTQAAGKQHLEAAAGKRTPRPAAPGAGRRKPAAELKSGISSPAAEATQRSADRPLLQLSADERARLIAEAAYLKAERRGFRGGSPEQDWYDAEAQIDAMLMRQETASE